MDKKFTAINNIVKDTKRKRQEIKEVDELRDEIDLILKENFKTSTDHYLKINSLLCSVLIKSDYLPPDCIPGSTLENSWISEPLWSGAVYEL